MALSSNINLIKKNNGLPEYLAPLENQYRNLSILTLFIVFLAGILTVFGFLLIQIQVQNVTRQKNTANRKLEAQKVKENLYLAVKSRIGVVDGVLKSSHGKSVLINDAMTIAPPPNLKNIAENDSRKLMMNFSCGSIEQCISMADTAKTLYSDKKLKNIFMTGFSLGKGGISISFESVPVWTE